MVPRVYSQKKIPYTLNSSTAFPDENFFKKATNTGFVDSRVERGSLKDLWTLRWHRLFKLTNDVSIQ